MIPAVIRNFPRNETAGRLARPARRLRQFFHAAAAAEPLERGLPHAGGTVGEYASLMGFWRALAPRMSAAYLEVVTRTWWRIWNGRATRVEIFGCTLG